MENRGTVLIVEDDKKLLNANRILLENEGYETETAETISRARELLVTSKIDMIVLDVMLPDGNGVDFLTGLRRTSGIPVLLLTALDTDDDIIKGLEAGGDDYLVKPFSGCVLSARINTVLRRMRASETMEYGAITFDMKSLTAYMNGVDMLLTEKDFALLRFFTQHENRYMMAGYLYEQIWGKPMNEDNRAVKTAVFRLRTKLAGSEYAIMSKRGRGYCFGLFSVFESEIREI